MFRFKSLSLGNLAKLFLVSLIGLFISTGSPILDTSTARAGEEESSNEAIISESRDRESNSPESDPSIEASEMVESIYLPLLTNQPKLATRMGYGITWPRGGRVDDILTFENASLLKAGWFLNWGVTNAPTPNGIEYAQMIRVHQSLSCEDENGNQHLVYAFRDECPYVQPIDAASSYRFSPSQSAIETVAALKPGSIWLVGNEIEREDWAVCGERDNDKNCIRWFHKGQDEILPETYAVAFHEIHGIIKAADPTAQVAIGGVIQVTPLRIQYLTAIYDAYLARYGEPIPVDIWNVHAFAFTEDPRGGAGVPVGIDPESEGLYIGRPDLHIDMSVIEEQIYLMRNWMKERGEQEKPLIISEYGLVYPNSLMGYSNADPTPVIDFLIDSSTFFLNTKDCDLGYTEDDCRLVQRWNWFSLDGRTQAANPHAQLLDLETGELSPLGEAWRAFVQENHADLYME